MQWLHFALTIIAVCLWSCQLFLPLPFILHTITSDISKMQIWSWHSSFYNSSVIFPNSPLLYHSLQDKILYHDLDRPLNWIMLFFFISMSLMLQIYWNMNILCAVLKMVHTFTHFHVFSWTLVPGLSTLLLGLSNPCSGKPFLTTLG